MAAEHIEYFKTFKNFYNKSRAERLSILCSQGIISKDDVDALLESSRPNILQDADHLIENTIGCLPVPLGIATSIVINNKPYLVPLATEETSIIAALSSAAKWVLNNNGSITTSQTGSGIKGQVYYDNDSCFSAVEDFIAKNYCHLRNSINNNLLSSMVKRGGGLLSINCRNITKINNKPLLAVDIILDCCDAMGANLICQAAELVRNEIKLSTAANGRLAIVSNLSDCLITTAKIDIPGVDSELANAIVAANDIAKKDVYRAVTHNKGITNGIDAIAIATGNDWRAIEASLHGYAGQGGYHPLTEWIHSDGVLSGVFSGPIPAATVGGATNQEIVRICQKIIGVNSASELRSIMAGVGILQNLAALKALVTKGIVSGHMRLHIGNLITQTDASFSEKIELQSLLEERLACLGKLTATDAIELLQQIRLKLGVV